MMFDGTGSLLGECSATDWSPYRAFEEFSRP
jgi:hypothetical protein